MIYIKLAVIALIFASGCYTTRLYYVNKLNNAIIATQKAEAALVAAGSKIEIKYVKEIEYIKVQGAERTRTVTVYVPKIEYVPSENCPNPNVVRAGLVEFHNAAAENRPLKELTSADINTETTISLDHFADIVNKNYTMCNSYITQIERLQEFLTEIERKTK